MNLVMFCDSLSVMEPPCGNFTLKIAEFSCNPLLRGSPRPPFSTPIYVNACGVDKKLSKMVENLASYCICTYNSWSIYMNS